MKTLRAYVVVAVAALAWATACGQDRMFDPTDPTLDGARLEIVGSAAVNLRYGNTADLQVR